MVLVALGTGAGRSDAWTVTAPDGRAFAVFRLSDGSLRVTDAACPHNGGPLAEGRIREAGDEASTATVTCPWHWYRFSLAITAAASPPAATRWRSTRSSTWTGRRTPRSATRRCR